MVKWGLLKSNTRRRGQVQATFNITFYSKLVKSIHVRMGIKSQFYEWNRRMLVNTIHAFAIIFLNIPLWACQRLYDNNSTIYKNMLCIFLQRLTQPYFLEKQVLIFLRLKHKIKSKLIRMIKTFHNAFKMVD